MNFTAVLSLCLVATAMGGPSKVQKVLPVKDMGGRIINGDYAKLGQIPWQVGLILDGEMFCGGSLIDPKWVLTAGHCVKKMSSAEVHLGIVDFHDSNTVLAKSARLIPHPDLVVNIFLIQNDIALIELETPVTLTENIQTIKLASSELGANVDVQVSGWGRTSDLDPSISDKLKSVNLMTMPNEKCSKVFSFIGDEVVCTEANYDGEIRGACNGDSGGPLVLNNEVVGVVSFSSATGCESGSPTAFTRVATFTDWIKETTGIK